MMTPSHRHLRGMSNCSSRRGRMHALLLSLLLCQQAHPHQLPQKQLQLRKGLQQQQMLLLLAPSSSSQLQVNQALLLLQAVAAAALVAQLLAPLPQLLAPAYLLLQLSASCRLQQRIGSARVGSSASAAAGQQQRLLR
jgi:hypothetical protein